MQKKRSAMSTHLYFSAIPPRVLVWSRTRGNSGELTPGTHHVRGKMCVSDSATWATSNTSTTLLFRQKIYSPRRHEFVQAIRYVANQPNRSSRKLTSDTPVPCLRCVGDLSHLASIFILVHKIYTTRSCRGGLAFLWPGRRI